MAIKVIGHGEHKVLGMLAGDAGEGAALWLNVLTELENPGVLTRMSCGGCAPWAIGPHVTGAYPRPAGEGCLVAGTPLCRQPHAWTWVRLGGLCW